MSTSSLRHVAPDKVSLSKGVIAAIVLLSVAAIALILIQHHVHLQWKAAWIAVIVFADLAVLSLAVARSRGGLLRRGGATRDAGDPSSPLMRMLADLNAHDAQSEDLQSLSEDRQSLGEERQSISEEPQNLQETMLEVQPAEQIPNGEVPKAEPAATIEMATPIVEVAAAQTDGPPPAASDAAIVAAQRLVAEQRKAAEALLREACVLEERLKSEAKVAQAVSEYAMAKAKAQNATILEQQAKELAQVSSEQRAVLAAELENAERLVATTRGDAEAAEAQVTALEQQLRDAQRSADQALLALESLEAHAKEVAEKQAAAEHEAAEATARAVACQAERATAENEAKAAEERAEALRKELPEPAQTLAGIDDVETLAARIAEQASALKRGAQTASL